MALTTGGSRPPTDSGTGQSEAMRNPEEGPAGRSPTSTSHQSLTVSTSPAATRTGPPPKLPSEQLRRSRASHHIDYQQQRKPAETDWHDSYVSKEQHWRDKQRDRVVTRDRGDLLREAEQESQREDISMREDTMVPEQGCHNKDLTSQDPFSETPGLITEPSNKEPEDQQRMDLV